MATQNTVARRQTRSARERNQRSRSSSKKGDVSSVRWNIPWGVPNLVGIGVGVVVIIIGYLLMNSAVAADPLTDKSQWNNSTSTALGPILLTIAYCVIIPVAIFWRKRDEASVVEHDSNSANI
ncbi:MAG: DUF3098 domain-containing protein [Ignavibacteriae bacterium]|nr:DUF3098 domain-containing protein [Ignavibacteriota bacterium]MCB9215273.1 DUF3098 domain-containing protein [Ignavibacteria bacterium]